MNTQHKQTARPSASTAPQSDNLVFIFGSPRSGTTWLGKIFDSHPQVRYLNEPDLARPPILPQFTAEESWTDLVPQTRAILQEWQATNVVRTVGIPPVFRKHGEGALRYNFRRASIYIGRALHKAIPSLEAFPPMPDPLPRGSALTVVKTINMLGRAGLVMTALPAARCVHLVRHPCGQIASVLRGREKFGSSGELSYGAVVDSPLGREQGITCDELSRMSPMEILAWKWAAFNDASYRVLKHSQRARIVIYEAVNRAPLEAVHDIFQFVDLPWDPHVATFIQSSTRATRPGRHYSVKRDPKTAAVRWKSELSEADVATIWDICSRSEVGALALKE